MKEFLLVFFTTLIIFVGVPQNVSAATLNFDKITIESYDLLPSDYGSNGDFQINWLIPATLVINNSYLQSSINSIYPGTYTATPTSGKYVITTYPFSPIIAIASVNDKLFNLNSFYLSSLLSPDTEFTVTGLNSSGKTITETLIASTDSFSYFSSSSFKDLSHVAIYGQGISSFALDDIDISTATPAPEPSSAILGLIGLTSLLKTRRSNSLKNAR